MEAVAGVCVILGACVLANNSIRNRPMGVWFFIGFAAVAAGFSSAW